MALVGQGWEYSVTLVDTGNNTATRVFKLDSADYTAAVADAADVLTALIAITKARVKGTRLAQVSVEDTFTYPADAQIEQLAEVVFQIAGDLTKTVPYAIPAPIDGLFIAAAGPSSNIVDTADTALQNFADLFRNAGPATISDGEKISVVLSGKRIHRGSRKG